MLPTKSRATTFPHPPEILTLCGTEIPTVTRVEANCDSLFLIKHKRVTVGTTKGRAVTDAVRYANLLRGEDKQAAASFFNLFIGLVSCLYSQQGRRQRFKKKKKKDEGWEKPGGVAL